MNTPVLPGLFKTKFALPEARPAPEVSETRRHLRDAKRGDVVTVGRTQWIVMRSLGDVQLLAYKHGSKRTKLYEIRLETEDAVVVFQVGGSGQRLSENVATGPFRTTGVSVEM